MAARGRPVGFGRNKSFYCLDWAVWDAMDRTRMVRAMVEVKGRSYAVNRGDTVSVSWMKVLVGLALEGAEGIPFIVLFAATNGLFRVRPIDVERVIRFGGRASRVADDGTLYRTEDDNEPMCHMAAVECELIQPGNFYAGDVE